MRWRGWRTLGLAIVSGLILLLLAGLLAWLAALVAGLAGLAALHFLLLPRLAARLRVSTFALGLLLLPALAAVGWGLGRREGLVIAAVLWGAGVALPRLAIGRLERALSLRVAVRTGSSPQRTETDWGQPRALEASACPRCGWVSVRGKQAGGEPCGRCGAAPGGSPGLEQGERLRPQP